MSNNKLHLWFLIGRDRERVGDRGMRKDLEYYSTFPVIVYTSGLYQKGRVDSRLLMQFRSESKNLEQ